MEIRKAVECDLPRMMEIYRVAQDYMIAAGNPGQWGHFYPSEEVLLRDIALGNAYLLCQREEIHGAFVMIAGDEPNYQRIEEGAWLNEEPYVTIHRVASDGTCHGIFREILAYCRAHADHIRIDTHEKNLTMQGQIRKNGFTYCGRIYVEDGTPRVAFQWSRGQ